MTKPIEAEPLEDEDEEEPLEDDEEEDEEEGLSLDHLAAAPVNVTGQVIDTSGVNWPFAVLQFSLVIPSGQIPVDLSTGLVVPNPAPIVADSSALFSIAILPNAEIVPATQWQVTIFPFNNMVIGQTLEPFTVTSAGLSISPRIHSDLIPFPIGEPFIVPLSHNGAVGRSSFNGSMYFDVVAQSLYVRNPATGAYIDIGGFTLPDPLLVNDLTVSGATHTGSLAVTGATQTAGITATGGITTSQGITSGTFPTATNSLNLAAGIDLNTVTRSGEYIVQNPVNGPTLTNPELLYLKVQGITAQFAFQQIWQADVPEHIEYNRKNVAGVWGPWGTP